MSARRFFSAAVVCVALAALLALGGCGPKGLSAAEQKDQCFSNQSRINTMEGLFHADSGIYAPIGDVTSKLAVSCPSGGKYTFNTDTGKVSCSVHGTAP